MEEHYLDQQQGAVWEEANGSMERCPAMFTAQVDVGTMLQQELHGVSLSLVGCPVEGCLAVIILSVHQLLA